MMRRRLSLLALLVTCATLLACGGDEPPPATGETDRAPAPRPPSTAPMDAPPPVVSHAPASSLPAGHPPIEGAGQPAVVPPPRGSGTGSAGLVWEVPEGWIEDPPSSNVRRAQYRVPGAAGEGECVVFYFGPGQGGDPMLNALRWASQFQQPDGGESSEVMVTREIEVGGIPVLLVELRGTYSNPMVGDRALPNHMLLGAVARGPDANWFFKLTGPEATVEAQRAAFEGLTKSLRVGGS